MTKSHCFQFFSLLFFIVVTLGFAESAIAQGYESGHGALQVWDEEGRAGVPQWIRIWLTILQLSFISGVFFVRRRVEARWAVGGFIGVFASAVASQTLTEIIPLSGFIALLHVVFWTPALYLLLARKPFMKGRSVYAVWSAFLTFVILFSFLFDIPYTVVYFDHIFDIGLLT